MSTVTVIDPFQGALNGTVYGPRRDRRGTR